MRLSVVGFLYGKMVSYLEFLGVIFDVMFDCCVLNQEKERDRCIELQNKFDNCYYKNERYGEL